MTKFIGIVCNGAYAVGWMIIGAVVYSLFI